MKIDPNPKVNAKSLLAAAFGGLIAYLGVRSGGITGNEAWAVAGAVLAPLGVVWTVPNAKSKRAGTSA